MTEANLKIVDRAYALLRGDLKAEPDAPYMCLALVRVVIESAFYGGRYAWYSDFRTIVVDRMTRESADPYARDMERSLRDDAGMGLILPRLPFEGDRERYVDLVAALGEGQIVPGDLLWRWDAAPDRKGVNRGHVGILMPGGLVLENAPVGHPRGGALNRGPTHLTRLGVWPVTTVTRFDPEK